MAPVRTVGGLLIDGEERVLLGLRAAWKRAWPQHWDVVGGHVEPGENLEDTLVREFQEEIGVTPTVFHYLTAMAEPRPEQHGPATHHLFAVTAWTGEAANLCDEHTEIRWFSAEAVRALPNLVDADYPAWIDAVLRTRG